MFDQSLLIWGLVLILAFPIFTILLGEGIEILKRNKNPFVTVLLNIRRWLLPPLAVLLVMEYILEVSNTDISLQIVESLFWIAFTYVLTLFINILFETGTVQKTWQINIPNLLFQLIRAALILWVVIYLLGNIWQVNLTQIASAAGIGSLVIALALQDTLSNLVSGFLLILEAPFKIGDWIKVGSIEGEVIDINWRAVRLKNWDRDIVIIPNGSLGKDTIQNYTIIDPLHIEPIVLCFSCFDPPNRVIQMLHQTAINTQGVMSNPPPLIGVKDYKNTAIEYKVRFCIRDYMSTAKIKAEFMTRVYYAAKRYKLTFPYVDKIEYKMDDFPQEAGVKIEEIAAFLKTLPYFTFLDKQTIQQLAIAAILEYFGMGERMIQAGEIDRKIYIILEGSVLLSVKDMHHHEQELVFLSQGDLFGEAALLKGEVSLVSVTVIDDLKVIAIEPETMTKIIDQYPKFSLEMNNFIRTRQQAIRNAKGVKLN